MGERQPLGGAPGSADRHGIGTSAQTRDQRGTGPGPALTAARDRDRRGPGHGIGTGGDRNTGPGHGTGTAWTRVEKWRPGDGTTGSQTGDRPTGTARR